MTPIFDFQKIMRVLTTPLTIKTLTPLLEETSLK